MKCKSDISQAIVDGINDAHLSVDELSERTGIARSTIYDRLRNPSSMRLDELRAINRIVHFSNGQMYRIVGAG